MSRLASRAGALPALALILALTTVPLEPAAASDCADWNARPGWRGQTDLSYLAEHVVTSGDRAWVSAGDTELTVIDVSDPRGPHPIGSVTMPAAIAGLATDGTWLYVATEAPELLVLDLANPDAPAIVGSVPTAGPSSWPVVHGSSVYLPLGLGGFEIVDASVPSAPVSVTVASQHTVHQIAVSGDRAVTTAAATFRVWDLSDPAAPAPGGFVQEVSTIDFDVHYGDLVLQGDTAYFLRSDTQWNDFGTFYWDHGGIVKMDISDPVNPVWQEYQQIAPNHSERMRRVGDLLYIKNEAQGLHIYDGVASGSLQLLHRVLSEDAEDLALGAVAGVPLALVLAPSGRLETLCVSNPEEPSYVTPINYRERLLDLTVVGSHGYSVSSYSYDDGSPGGHQYWDTMRSWDLTDPANPAETSSVSYHPGWAARSLVWIGDDLYLPGFGLYRMSPALPGGSTSDPVIVGTVPGLFTDGAAVGSYLYLGSTGNGLTVLDASGPGDPVPVATDDTWPVVHLEVDGSLGVVAMSGRVAVLDVSQPASPAYRGTIDGITSGTPSWLTVSGSRAAVGIGGAIHLLDLTDPDLPVVTASWSHTGGGEGGRILGDILYVGTGERGCFAWDISDPGSFEEGADLEPLGVWSTGQSLGFQPVGDRLLAFAVGGLAPLLPACQTVTVGVAEIGPVANGMRLIAGPNPFRAGTTFRWAAPGARRASLDVLDATGRRVRRLVTGPASAGAGVVAWDGRDAKGRPVAAGVYFVRLEAASGTAVGKVTRLR